MYDRERAALLLENRGKTSSQLSVSFGTTCSFSNLITTNCRRGKGYKYVNSRSVYNNLEMINTLKFLKVDLKSRGVNIRPSMTAVPSSPEGTI